jgi:hypothetical protein
VLNKWSCPAKYGGDFLAAGTITAAVAAVATNFITATNWWCSDGTFNLTTSAVTGTTAATAISFGAVITTFAAG